MSALYPKSIVGSGPAGAGSCPIEQTCTDEQKALTDVLMPNPPPRNETCGLKDADDLNPTDEEVLSAVTTDVGVPTRAVLTRAELMGPRTGWRDGHLSSLYGFLPPDPSASPAALAQSPGRVWSELCDRLADVVSRGQARESILNLPNIDPNTIPDDALWAAVVCLGILAHTYRYEERYSGREADVPGVTRATQQLDPIPTIEDDPDEDPETKGLPRNISVPYRIISGRLGRPLPHLTPFDLSLNNYKIRDLTGVNPYPERSENMDLRWTAFRDRTEAIFLLCFTEFHGCSKPAVEIIVRCQEYVMQKDNEGLLYELIKLKTIIDQLNIAFHKINLNPNSEQFANAIEWGQKYAKFSYPLSGRVPMNSGIHLPLFHVMDAFLGRTDYSSFLGTDELRLRKWLPFNIRAFVVAVEKYYKVPDYVRSSGDPRLIGILKGIVESYTGERGFMGIHRYKAFGFLEVVGKTGRPETNGGSGAASIQHRPWEEVHSSLSEAMKERLAPYDSIMSEPHETRGTFEECRFKARIVSRQNIARDCDRKTAKITIDVSNTGLTFAPGDRLAIMPCNSRSDIEKVVKALNLFESLDEPVFLDGDWKIYLRHVVNVDPSGASNHLSVRDILRKGKLAPMTKDIILKVHSIIQEQSPTVAKMLQSDVWPIQGSLGDLLMAARCEVPEKVWNDRLPSDDLSWLTHFIPIEVPRTYNISNFSTTPLPSSIELTVTRSTHKVCPELRTYYTDATRSGVSSGFLNPSPLKSEDLENDEVIIGISQPFHFQLPPVPEAPVIMFAGGSGIAPFRGFWEARAHEERCGRNVLFFGVQTRETFLYETEIRQQVRYGRLEAHIAFSQDKRGLFYDRGARELVDARMEPRYVDAAILDQSSDLREITMSKQTGGSGGYIYVCGSASFYETVSQALHKVLYGLTKGESILSRAFAEGRFMLDVFTAPRSISLQQPVITFSELARNTGHTAGGRVWIGLHGSVYDVTDYLQLHPGGRLIVAANAGLDASSTFDLMAHTNNGEVKSLLSKYFIGYLASPPKTSSKELGDLRDVWMTYLSASVETLTTFTLELKSIQDKSFWFKGDQLDMCMVRKFYQFQSRFMQKGIQLLFGALFQKTHLNLSSILDKMSASTKAPPDVAQVVLQAQSSIHAVKALNNIASIGELFSESNTALEVRYSVFKHATVVTQLDQRFLEQIRDEVCNGIDALDTFESIDSGAKMRNEKLRRLAYFLLFLLQRLAHRLYAFYADIATHSIHDCKAEKRSIGYWKLLARRIKTGSFFIFSKEALFKKNSSCEVAIDPFRSHCQTIPRLSSQQMSLMPHEPSRRMSVQEVTYRPYGSVRRLSVYEITHKPYEPVRRLSVHQMTSIPWESSQCSSVQQMASVPYDPIRRLSVHQITARHYDPTRRFSIHQTTFKAKWSGPDDSTKKLSAEKYFRSDASNCAAQALETVDNISNVSCGIRYVSPDKD